MPRPLAFTRPPAFTRPVAATLGALALAQALAGCPAPAAGPVAGPGKAPVDGKAAPADVAGVVGHNGGAITTRNPGQLPTAGASSAPLAVSADAAALGRALGEGAADDRDLADYGYIFDDGSGIVAAGGGNMVAAGGGNMVAAGGGNMVAAGAGNMVAAGAGNYDLASFPFGLLAEDTVAAADTDLDVDAPTLTPELGALADAGLKARLRERRKALGARAAARLAARADRQAFVDAVGRAAITQDAAAGTKTYRFTAALPWKGFTRQVLFAYTVDAATNMLVHGYSAVLRPRPARPKKPFHQVRREFRLLADGGFQVTYFQTTALPTKDLRRVVRWEKTVAPDGQLTGQGRIAWSPLGQPGAAPVRAVTLALGGREEDEAITALENGTEAALRLPIDAPPAATAKDPGAASAAPLDLEALPPEAPPEDPAQPAAF